MQLEDPRFLFANITVGVTCAVFHAPLVVLLLSCAAVGLLTVPPFILSKVNGFWAAYRPSNIPVIWSILRDRSNIPFQKVWVIVAALVLLACCAGVFGLIMTETLLPRVSNFEALGRPFAPVAITIICIYGLYRGLMIWARKKQITR